MDTNWIVIGIIWLVGGIVAFRVGGSFRNEWRWAWLVMVIGSLLFVFTVYVARKTAVPEQESEDEDFLAWSKELNRL